MKFVSRSQWGARPPTGNYSSINSTVTTGHWEGPHMGSFPHDSCATKVRGIQAYHMDQNGWTDIAYNGLACPHGYVFEGRGPQHRSAANGTDYANGTSAVICYIGGEGDPFTPEGQQAMSDGAGWLGDPMFKGHRDWYNTACPGDVIYGWITSGAHVPEPPKPQPKDLDMTPAVLATSDGRIWYFVTGVNKEVWAKIAGESDWFSLGGISLAGVDATQIKDGSIRLAVKGQDGGMWAKQSSPSGDFHGQGWWNEEGLIA